MKFKIAISNMESEQFIDNNELEKLKNFLAKRPRILVLAHANPDGDTLGGAFGIYTAFKNIGLNINIGCIDPISQKLQFLENAKDLVRDFNENDFDGFIFVDCGDKKMVKFQETKPRILSDNFIKINIDHHASNDLFGDINFVVTNATSSTEIVYYLLQKLEIRITPHIATSLLLGLYTDTGSFMHQNTTSQSYKAAGELVKLGGNVSQIANNVFQTYDLKTLKLWGRVLSNLHITQEGAAIVGVEKDEYESLGAKRSDLEGVIDFINSMPEAKYAVILSEDEKGNVKASFRTRKSDVDVKALAEKFGGGGHVKASGFTIPHGHLEKEIKWRIVQDT